MIIEDTSKTRFFQTYESNHLYTWIRENSNVKPKKKENSEIVHLRTVKILKESKMGHFFKTLMVSYIYSVRPFFHFHFPHSFYSFQIPVSIKMKQVAFFCFAVGKIGREVTHIWYKEYCSLFFKKKNCTRKTSFSFKLENIRCHQNLIQLCLDFKSK